MAVATCCHSQTEAAMTRVRELSLVAFVCMAVAAEAVADDTIAFLVGGDPQYLAEKSDSPTRLDPYSEQAAVRMVQVLKQFAGRTIPEQSGGGEVSSNIRGLIVTGDLIDSADKNGGPYPAMQRFEWERFISDFGVTARDGRIPFPAYELHGNHDGPQGDTFVIEEIIRRNRQRKGVHYKGNGLHYSWDWGPLHCVNLGIFVGTGERRREDHHYSPRASFDFLADDLATHVGESGRPVILSFHLHPNCPEYDWPKEDLAALWEITQAYNVIALFHGHTHGSPPKRLRWDGNEFSTRLKSGVDVFDPDDLAAAKSDRRKPGQGVGLRHGFLYVELIDSAGTEHDRFVVRSYATKDNWATHDWGNVWSKHISVPDTSR